MEQSELNGNHFHVLYLKHNPWSAADMKHLKDGIKFILIKNAAGSDEKFYWKNKLQYLLQAL